MSRFMEKSYLASYHGQRKILVRNDSNYYDLVFFQSFKVPAQPFVMTEESTKSDLRKYSAVSS